jgi:hypothetical protein
MRPCLRRRDLEAPIEGGNVPGRQPRVASGGLHHRSTGDDLRRSRYPELAASLLLTFCSWAPTVLQNICRRVALRQRLICYKERSIF